MPLVKATFQQALEQGFKDLMQKQADRATADGEEPKSPADIIAIVAADMAKVVADATDDYIKSGDITVGPSEVGVVSAQPGSSATVSSLKPAKIT